MTPILLSLLLQDLRDRFVTFSLSAALPSSINNRLGTDRRLYYAIEEAIKQFILISPPEMLSGYLEETDLTEGTPSLGLEVYPWPAKAARGRADGGLINITIKRQSPAGSPPSSVDIQEFIHFPVTDPRMLQLELASLQAQAQSPLLYGDHFTNYLIDLNTKRIYAPENKVVSIRYIKNHQPFDYAYSTQMVPGPGEDMVPAGYYKLPNSIPVDAAFLEEISRRALAQLVGHASLPQAGQQEKE